MYTLLAIYPLTLRSQHISNSRFIDVITYLPKNVQQTIITVAMEPRFDGDRNPKSANTAKVSGCELHKAAAQQTQRDAGHCTQLRAIPHKHGEYHRISRGAENLAVDQLPTEIFLNVLLKSREGDGDT